MTVLKPSEKKVINISSHDIPRTDILVTGFVLHIKNWTPQAAEVLHPAKAASTVEQDLAAREPSKCSRAERENEAKALSRALGRKKVIQIQLGQNDLHERAHESQTGHIRGPANCRSLHTCWVMRYTQLKSTSP